MTADSDDLVERLKASGRLSPSVNRHLVPLSDLPPELRPYAQIVDELTAVAQYSGAPRLEDDRAARLLGLVPSADRRLNGGQLRMQRQRRKQTVGQIAKGLRQRGWSFTPADVMRWENSEAADVPPIVIESLASLLGAAADDLTLRKASADNDLVAQLRSSVRFSTIVDRWARLRKMTVDDARAALESRVLSTVHRGSKTNIDDTLASLETLVSALEKRDEL